MVERGVSSAVHTIHIGASPDAVKKKKGLLGKKKPHTHTQTHIHQTNTANPYVKSLTVGVTDSVLIAI